jgi:hypothetical protein
MLILTIVVVVSAGTAYLAVWSGLGGHQSLSPANSWFALRVGVIFGFIVSAVLICLPVRLIKRHPQTAFVVMTSMQFVFGFAFMLWTSMIASC